MSETEDDLQRAAVLQKIGGDTGNLELLNSELASNLNRQADASSKVDTKVAFLLGLIATATQFLATRHPEPVLGALAFTSYAAAFTLGVPALAIRSYAEINPEQLLQRYADKTKTETLLALTAVRVSNFATNDDNHEKKTTWWWRSFAATIIGLVFSVAAIMDAGSHDNSTGPQQPATSTSPASTGTTAHATSPTAKRP